MLQSLYPGDWKDCIKRLNSNIREGNQDKRRTDTYVNQVTPHEYWTFIGIMLLCTVTKSGGMDGLYLASHREGIIESPRGQTFMSKRRMKEIKKVWVTQFENKSQKDTNPWWRVNRLVDDFNANRKKMVASSRVKTMDESMSAYRPQKTKTGNLPNISYIQR